MEIGRQWSQRLGLWLRGLELNCFEEKEVIDFIGVTTNEKWSLQKAIQAEKTPMPEGKTWGKMWEYAWFESNIYIPNYLDGKWLELCIGVGQEMLVWVNRQCVGSIDKHHHRICLSEEVKAGENYEIIVEAYAGHGPRLEKGGPCPEDQEAFSYPIGDQQVVKNSLVGVWNEVVYQTYMDYLCLYQLLAKLPDSSLRAQKILDGLQRFTLVVDLELPRLERLESIQEGRDILLPLLAMHNSDTVATMSVIGQSHLDLAWLWTLQETRRKAMRTYSNQLTLMERYPSFKFLACEPPILEFLREEDLETFQKVLSLIKDKRMVAEGAVWIEGDCNIPSGETLIRQFYYGKLWFKEVLGIDSQLVWMPDTFGFSPVLPQIMRGMGIPYFTTQKLLRADPETSPFPYNNFWWEGIDGSRVLSHLYKKNNAKLEPQGLIERWEEDRLQKDDIEGMIYPFGFGDGGGGPTRDMLEMYERCKDLEGLPKCRMESPLDYMQRLERKGVKDVYSGELYLAWHRGTYTSQARMKRYLRKTEALLRDIEFWWGIGYIDMKSLAEDWQETMDVIWKKLLMITFHDILPGTSIQQVYEEAMEDYMYILQEGQDMLRQVLSRKKEGVYHDKSYAFNSLGFDRYDKGCIVPAYGFSQREDRIETSWSEEKLSIEIAKEEKTIIENNYLRVMVDGQGEIVSLIAKDSAYEWIKQGESANHLRMYKDVPGYYDAWEIDAFTESKDLEIDLQGKAQIEGFHKTEAVGVKIKRILNHSTLEQVVYLRKGQKRVNIKTRIWWQERHKLLKVDIPVNALVKEAICDIQFGYLKRPTHKSQTYEKDRYEVCHHKYAAMDENGRGLAIINDSKYGISFHGSTASLTLLKAPIYPDKSADQGWHIFSYALFPYEAEEGLIRVIEEAEDFNVPLLRKKTGLDYMPKEVLDHKKSNIDLSYRLFWGLKRNIRISGICPSRSHKKAIRLRLFETLGHTTRTSFQTGMVMKSLYESDMLENPLEEIHPNKEGKNIYELVFRAFEIKTLLWFF